MTPDLIWRSSCDVYCFPLFIPYAGLALEAIGLRRKLSRAGLQPQGVGPSNSSFLGVASAPLQLCLTVVRQNEGANRRPAAFRLNPLSQIAFAPITHSPCRPPSSHERPAHHKQQPGAERACRSSAQRPAVAAGGRPFRRRCWLGPRGTDKIAFLGPSGSVPIPAIRPRPASDSPQRPIGNFPS